MNWGDCDFASWPNDIIAISSEREHTIGLRADGSVVATGENKCGKCDVQGWNLFK